MENINPLDSKTYQADLKKAAGNVSICELKNKSVLITGGLGLICSAVVDILISANENENAGIDIVVAARNEEKFQKRYGKADSVRFVRYDALEPISFDENPDFIIHGAGLASPELYVNKPVETILSNFNGVLNLLELAKAKGVKRLLYVSSSEVYGSKTTEDPFLEGNYGSVNIDNIRSSYPVAKQASEQLCKAYSSEYGVETVIVRPGHIYGPTASVSDGRISSDFAFKAARGEELIMKSPGLQKRSYCYCLDTAVAILTALLKGQSGESYNIGHDEITTIRRMAEVYALEGGVKLEVAEPSEAELKAFNPMNNSSLDNEKIKNLGYRDTFAVEEGLRHTVRIIKELI